MHTPRSGKTLVIGFGSDLCGDDRAGRVVAEEIARWDHHDVETISVHQLGPEFAKEIADSQMVIFVDAFAADRPIAELIERAGLDTQPPFRMQSWIGPDSVTARITHPMLVRLYPMEFEVVLGHAPNPSVLLVLARALYGRSPRAYMIGIPATNFEFGDALSRDTQAAIDEAVQMVKELILWTPHSAARKQAEYRPSDVTTHA